MISELNTEMTLPSPPLPKKKHKNKHKTKQKHGYVKIIPLC